MPTIMTHAFSGAVCASLSRKRIQPARFWFFSLLCSILPDGDVITFVFDIPYAHFLGHRGFFHSLFFALILSVLIVLLFFKTNENRTKHYLFLIIYFFLITASHGILDAATSGGMGIALFSPFDTSRYFFPCTPIEVSPIGLKAFLNERGIRVLLSEIRWVWMPLLSVFILMKAFQWIRIFRSSEKRFYPKLKL